MIQVKRIYFKQSDLGEIYTLLFLGKDLAHKSYWGKVVPLAKIKENDSTCTGGGEDTILSEIQDPSLDLY